MDSKAIQPDIQTEREFILASNDSQHSVFVEHREDFDTLPNAITTGVELEDSPGPVDDEHLNEELDVVIKLNNQKGAAVEVTGEERTLRLRLVWNPTNQTSARPSLLSLRFLDGAIEYEGSLGVLTLLSAKTRGTPTLTGGRGDGRSTPKSSNQNPTLS